VEGLNFLDVEGLFNLTLICACIRVFTRVVDSELLSLGMLYPNVVLDPSNVVTLATCGNLLMPSCLHAVHSS